MLTQLFTSKTRIKLLLKLFLNPGVSCYLRELAKEFALSPNALKEELDSLSSAGYLEREQNGRSSYFRANTGHPFYPEISSIVRKTIGIDQLLDEVLASLGKVEAVYILDDYALGKDTGLIDLLVVGEVDRTRLDELASIAESKINRKVRVLAVDTAEFSRCRDIFVKRPNWKIL
ncbi:MAG: winged helix-turn-helix domain-containing protein [Proteobacteria bacterium]|nr:winged helix-turn-helix domain-containing protein [Pseudomonadota bacterium]MBU1593922.1 winged helix-turn-helix domain-containing protein [Pseudomonadota bacterium]